MNKKIKLINLFWIGYFLVLFADMFINVKIIDNYVKIINFVGLIFLIVYMIISNTKFNKKVFIIMILLFTISFITYFYYKDFTIMKFLILSYCLKNISFDNLVKKDYCIKLVLFVTLLILSFLNLCNVTSFIRGDTTRYTLGFIHPNTTGFFIMIITFEYLYINRNKISYKHVALLLMIILFTKYVTDSRSSVMALTIMFISIFFIKFFKNKILKLHMAQFIIKNFMLIVTLISFTIVISYSNNVQWAIDINDKLSNRIYYLYNALERYNITMFGNVLPENIILDNQYISFILNFGIIFYLIYYCLFYIKFKNLIKEENYFMIMLLLILLIYGLMEKTVFKASYNVFMLSLSSVLFRHIRKEKLDEK